MKRVDLNALKRAIVLAKNENPGRAAQIDAMMHGWEGWQRAAEFAAYCCQCRTLRLKPWQSPPCSSGPHNNVDDFPGAGRAAAAQLLKRLLDAGLSRWEPDPIAALERVEAAKPAKEALRQEEAGPQSCGVRNQ
jgi:hypothetical protein